MRKIHKEEPMNTVEELAQSLGSQLAEAIQEVIKLTHQLRVTKNNYEDLQREYVSLVKRYNHED